MVNANLIARRIDSTCDILGEENLKASGFYHVIGYILILKELNQMSNEMVANIICELNEMDGIYKSFGEHILNDGVLLDKFFELDNNLQDNNTNIKKIIQDKEVKEEENDDNSFLNIEHKFQEENEEIKKLYENNKTAFKNSTLEILKNESLKQEYELSQNSFNAEFERRINDFKNKFNPTIYDWMVKNIPTLSDEDYGMLMSLIYKLRKNE
jgi:hypothetical protein